MWTKFGLLPNLNDRKLKSFSGLYQSEYQIMESWKNNILLMETRINLHDIHNGEKISIVLESKTEMSGRGPSLPINIRLMYGNTSTRILIQC